jgi:hypothetical protein
VRVQLAPGFSLYFHVHPEAEQRIPFAGYENSITRWKCLRNITFVSSQWDDTLAVQPGGASSAGLSLSLQKMQTTGIKLPEALMQRFSVNNAPLFAENNPYFLSV